MTLLSLDQASRVSGYAIFKDGKLDDYGKFEFSDEIIDERLLKIRTTVEELVEEYKPDEVVYEDIQQQNNVVNNVQTFKILAEVYGVVGELLQELAIPHSTMLAATWKSQLGIKGRTRPDQKRNAQQWVKENYNVTATQDEVDSICIGAAYLKERECAW